MENTMQDTAADSAMQDQLDLLTLFPDFQPLQAPSDLHIPAHPDTFLLPAKPIHHFQATSPISSQPVADASSHTQNDLTDESSTQNLIGNSRYLEDELREDDGSTQSELAGGEFPSEDLTQDDLMFDANLANDELSSEDFTTDDEASAEELMEANLEDEELLSDDLIEDDKASRDVLMDNTKVAEHVLSRIEVLETELMEDEPMEDEPMEDNPMGNNPANDYLPTYTATEGNLSEDNLAEDNLAQDNSNEDQPIEDEPIEAGPTHISQGQDQNTSMPAGELKDIEKNLAREMAQRHDCRLEEINFLVRPKFTKQNTRYEHLLQRARTEKDMTFHYRVHLFRLQCIQKIIRWDCQLSHHQLDNNPKIRKRPSSKAFLIVLPLERRGIDFESTRGRAKRLYRAILTQRQENQVYRSGIQYLLEFCEERLKKMNPSFAPFPWRRGREAFTPKLKNRWADGMKGWTGLKVEEEALDCCIGKSPIKELEKRRTQAPRC